MKVAIVEDDAVMALLLEEICRTSGYQVAGIASTASTAVPMLKATRPDCLLLDYGLAGEGDGLDVLEQARRIVPSLFCVMITAWDINDIAGRIDRVQPDRILRKPIHVETLVGILAVHRKSLPGAAERSVIVPSRSHYRWSQPIALL